MKTLALLLAIQSNFGTVEFYRAQYVGHIRADKVIIKVDTANKSHKSFDNIMLIIITISFVCQIAVIRLFLTFVVVNFQ